MQGIHVHLRSQILDADLLCTYYQNCYALAERISQMQGIDLSFINFGSGIGTVYDISTEKPLIFEKTRTDHGRNCMNEILKSLNAKFILETGRFVVCNAGSYYTKVVDRKISCGKTFIVVQNAMNGFLRPAIAELLRQNLGDFPSQWSGAIIHISYTMYISYFRKEGNPEQADVVETLCTSLDVLAKILFSRIQRLVIY